MNDQHEAFYGYEVIRDKEHEIVLKLMKKYQNEPVTEELKGRIWDEMQTLKHQGVITIPFRVEIRRDSTHKFPSYVEVILDTKV